LTDIFDVDDVEGDRFADFCENSIRKLLVGQSVAGIFEGYPDSNQVRALTGELFPLPSGEGIAVEIEYLCERIPVLEAMKASEQFMD
jgi:hypothetical protein